MAEYRRHFYNKRGADFYLDDIYQIARISKFDLYSAIGDSLEIGFMIGYRRAKRELRNKKENGEITGRFKEGIKK